MDTIMLIIIGSIIYLVMGSLIMMALESGGFVKLKPVGCLFFVLFWLPIVIIGIPTFISRTIKK